MDERDSPTEIKTAELSTYGNFAKCHQAHFRVPHVGLGMRLSHTHAMPTSTIYGVTILDTSLSMVLIGSSDHPSFSL